MRYATNLIGQKRSDRVFTDGPIGGEEFRRIAYSLTFRSFVTSA